MIMRWMSFVIIARYIRSITEPSDISSHEVMTQSDETSFLPQFSKFSQNSDRTLRVT